MPQSTDRNDRSKFEFVGTVAVPDEPEALLPGRAVPQRRFIGSDDIDRDPQTAGVSASEEAMARLRAMVAVPDSSSSLGSRIREFIGKRHAEDSREAMDRLRLMTPPPRR